MAQITISNLDDAVLTRMKRCAWQHGISLEEWVLRTLSGAAWAGHDDDTRDDYAALLTAAVMRNAAAKDRCRHDA